MCLGAFDGFGSGFGFIAFGLRVWVVCWVIAGGFMLYCGRSGVGCLRVFLLLGFLVWVVSILGFGLGSCFGCIWFVWCLLCRF